jgi:antitoxin HicB
MHTSRAQVNGILDPDKGNVTIETLQRAAHLLGRRLKLELVCAPNVRAQQLKKR